ncbi:Mfs monocarboxylate transporter [Mycena venus]|uniref:Mfs monocarboxylate transporter n=1 Tax=Mycena venus TaxID=2733690 RepID=A0A8H6XMU1_9AGAR|nr:Mfs monocarboxylate transporter [Mycena venus]
MYPKHAMIFVPGLVVERLFDIGHYRILFADGSPLVVFSCFLVPQCNVYWHFMLCQDFGVGVLSGLFSGAGRPIGSAFMFSTMFAIVRHWFRKRHGFALGLTCFGGAIGATWQPIILRQLIAKAGYVRQFSGAYLSLRYSQIPVGHMNLMFLVLVITNLCLSRRLSPAKAPGSILGLHAFCNRAFSAFGGCTFATFLGLYTTLGISPNFAFYLVGTANLSSGVGRVTPGRFGEVLNPKFPELRLTVGAPNSMTIMTAIAGAASIAWSFCRTAPKNYGHFRSLWVLLDAWLALIGSAVGQMGGVVDIGRRLGTINTIAGIGALCGPPISGFFTESRLGYVAGEDMGFNIFACEFPF